MSEQHGRPPLDLVKVEVEEEDGSGGGGDYPDAMEGGNEVNLLKNVANFLSNGPFLSCGSEGGAQLGRRLLDMGEKLEGWKKWERLCRSRVEENQDLTMGLEGAELRFEMMKESKAELRKTYDLEVDRRIKAEREVAVLREKGAEKSDVPVPEAFSSDSVDEETATLQDLEDLGSSSSKEDDSILQEQTGSCGEPGTPDLTAILPSSSYSLRRRSNQNSGAKAEEQQSDLLTSDDEMDLDETSNENTHLTKPKKHLQDPPVGQVKSQFSCRFCNKQFSGKRNLRAHLETHNPDKLYKCKECKKSFKTNRYLRKHLKTHNPNRERKFVCATCSKKCFSSSHLADHMAYHRSDTPLKCPQCPQRFKHPRLVKQHLITHSNQKPFKCELCEKNFKRLFQFENHLRVHTGERPYSCNICNNGFKDVGALSRHKRIHPGEEGKIHQCPFCTMKFFRKGDCQNHQQRRHQSELASSTELQPALKGKRNQSKTKTNRNDAAVAEVTTGQTLGS